MNDSVTSPVPSKLFSPIQIGFMNLQHRIVHAPTSRYRADSDSVPLMPIVGEYYAQRARVPGMLLISEGTLIARKAGGMPNIPGIWNERQIGAWKEVASRVHEHKSFIFLQIYALGRGADPEILDRMGCPYVSASDIPMQHASPDGKLAVKSVRRPRPLSHEEIEEYIRLFAEAASNAVWKAGLDGVEIHAAGGYLIDQFLQDMSNCRTDEYGGSIENRARFGLRVVEAVVRVVGEERTGIRISPWSTYQDEETLGMRMTDPKPTFGYFVAELKKRFPHLAYLHVQEPRADGWDTVDDLPEGVDNDFIREIWGDKVLVSSGGYDRKLAIDTARTKGDVIAFGRHFIANSRPLVPNHRPSTLKEMAVTRTGQPNQQPQQPSQVSIGKKPMTYSQQNTQQQPQSTTRPSARAQSKAPIPPHAYAQQQAGQQGGHNQTGKQRSSGTGGGTGAGGGGGGVPKSNSKIWSTSTTEERERIKEFWLGLGEEERRNLVKIEKDTVLRKMKEQQKHSCSCAVCGRKRNAIEEELEVLYDAYYEELEQYANYQQRYLSSGGALDPPPGPGPFPGSVELDKNGSVVGHPYAPHAQHQQGKHPPARPNSNPKAQVQVNGRGKHPQQPHSRQPHTHPHQHLHPRMESEFDDDDGDEEEYEEDDEYEEEEEEDEEEEEEDEEEEDEDDAALEEDYPTKGQQRRRPPGSNPPSANPNNGRDTNRKVNGAPGKNPPARDGLFSLGSSLTVAGPGNILTVADDLLKNDGQKFLEMMEQLAERRMQREEDAAKGVAEDSEDEDDGDEDDDDEDEDEDDDEDEDEDDEEEEVMTEEQKMEEGKRMFSIFAARMFEQRVLTAYREKVAQERQLQLLRELEDEDKFAKEREAKKQNANQKKKDKKRQQKLAKEEEKAKREAEKAADEAAVKAKQAALEDEQRRKRDEERARREAQRKAQEEERLKKEEERRKRVAEEKEREAERERKRKEKEEKLKAERREKEERDRKVREEKEERLRAEKAEKAEKAAAEKARREEKEREERAERAERERKEREKKEKEEKEREAREKAAQQQQKATRNNRNNAPTSPRSNATASGSTTRANGQSKKILNKPTPVSATTSVSSVTTNSNAPSSSSTTSLPAVNSTPPRPVQQPQPQQPHQQPPPPPPQQPHHQPRPMPQQISAPATPIGGQIPHMPPTPMFGPPPGMIPQPLSPTMPQRFPPPSPFGFPGPGPSMQGPPMSGGPHPPNSLGPSAVPRNFGAPGAPGGPVGNAPSPYDPSFSRGLPGGAPPAPIGPPPKSAGILPSSSSSALASGTTMLSPQQPRRMSVVDPIGPPGPIGRPMASLAPIARPSVSGSGGGNTGESSGGPSSGSGSPIRRSPSPKGFLGSSALVADEDEVVTTGPTGRRATTGAIWGATATTTSPPRSAIGDRPPVWSSGPIGAGGGGGFPGGGSIPPFGGRGPWGNTHMQNVGIPGNPDWHQPNGAFFQSPFISPHPHNATPPPHSG
ncbi:Stress response protein nst1 [Marasmius crinis-equi]|uniref:Stress response protein NST1 n=1 Tax=Marasmius crinis-equi TaxID=585013 RepID=A0ABR3FDU3_9AGAR